MLGRRRHVKWKAKLIIASNNKTVLLMNGANGAVLETLMRHSNEQMIHVDTRYIV